MKEISNTNLTLSIACIYLPDCTIRKEHYPHEDDTHSEFVLDTIYLENNQFNKINITYRLKDDFVVDEYVSVLMLPTFKSLSANIDKSLHETIFNILDKEFEFKSDTIMVDKIYIKVFTGSGCAINIDNYIKDNYDLKRDCYILGVLEFESKFSYERSN